MHFQSGALVAILTLLSAAACDTMHESADFERHTSSQLSIPADGSDYFWFDVRLSAAMPADDDAAESRRRQWLEGWLRQRGACPNGYEILERRKFDFYEDNPARYDLRYKVACISSAAPT